jgi:hypothetical protein
MFTARLTGQTSNASSPAALISVTQASAISDIMDDNRA